MHDENLSAAGIKLDSIRAASLVGQVNEPSQ